ncbi:hypothetical protein G7046_g3218 [Stylonectria norvegica]|nr:hypothetical protein G7046_g3218 [Stylonectria norvegica]
MATIATIPRISAQALSERMLREGETQNPTLAIVDVREDDYIGGHIKGAINIPNHQLDVMMPTLVRRLKDKHTVIFHCALSQVRGPSAALKYLRERDGLLRVLGEKVKGESEGPAGQKVYVLDQGFEGWQRVFGEDEQLTEGFSKELWRD